MVVQVEPLGYSQPDGQLGGHILATEFEDAGWGRDRHHTREDWEQHAGSSSEAELVLGVEEQLGDS